MRKKANKYNKKLAAHSMFIKGSLRAIHAGVDTIEHLTVDRPYSDETAALMAEKNISLIPTFSLGCFLAMNFGKIYSEDPEYNFYYNMRNEHSIKQMEQVALPELKESYRTYFDWLELEEENRLMPMAGVVYPERVHGFSKNAPESIKNFKKEGVKTGIGTDGGTGITFCGFLEKEFLALNRYGYSNKDILRMATLGNMEILDLSHKMGSIETGKRADMVLLEKNPLEEAENIKEVLMVFKKGRLYYEKI